MFGTHIAIEGNIGSGKSEILRRIGGAYSTIHEPVDMWRTWMGVDWLGTFLEHRTSYHAFMLQLVVLLSYATMSLPWWGVCVVERSVLSSVLVFCHQNLDDMGYRAMTGLHRVFCTHLDPRYIVYVRTAPEVCLQRLRERDREGEADSYTLDYIQKLHDRHEEVIASHPLCHAVVNGDLPPKQVAERVCQIVHQHTTHMCIRWWCVAWVTFILVIFVYLCS
jgi:thymidylate kinase